MNGLDRKIIEAARARSKAREGEEMIRAYEHFLRMGDIKSAIRRYKA
jgi:hypothetical protein